MTTDGVPTAARRADATLDLAQRLLAGVRAEAGRRGVALGAAVVDAGGNLVAALRMDGAQLVALPLAVDKAWTAVALNAPTETWAASTAPGGADWGMATALGGRLVVFAGGLPVRVDGAAVGGLGVSGAAAPVDRACAAAGLAGAGLEVP